MNAPIVRLAILFLLSLSGCGSDQPAGSCDLDRALTAEVAGRANVQHCDAFLAAPDAGADDAAAHMALAQKCVLDAIANKTPFTFAYDDYTTLNHLRIGLSGIPDASGHMLVTNYVYNGDGTAGVPGDAHPQLSKRSCAGSETQAAVTVLPSCTFGATRPCLVCNNTLGGVLVCGG
jgi:hypothetical protein